MLCRSVLSLIIRTYSCKYIRSIIILRKYIQFFTQLNITKLNELRCGKCLGSTKLGASPDCNSSETSSKYISTAVFKLGSANQMGSAMGSQGVHERIPKSSHCLHGC